LVTGDENSDSAICGKSRRDGYIYANPLPHVLMLTGIVVSAATTAVALAIVD